MRIVILAMVASLTGCYLFQGPALMVDMNGRKLEFETFQAGRIPKGMEVTHFDGQTLRLTGDRAIEVNGLSVQVHGDDITIAGRKLKVDRDATVVVHSGGEVEVRLPTPPAAGTAAKPASPTAPAKR